MQNEIQHLGKTRAAMSELEMHVTGKYPAWWKGKRFAHSFTVLVIKARTNDK